MEKKLILFDIDGTLIESPNEMSELTKYSLEQLKKAGHLVFIASGRCLCFMPREIQDYPMDGYIASNGASVHLHQKRIHHDIISLDKIQKLHLFSLEHDIIYFLEEDHCIYTNRLDDPLTQSFITKWQMNPTTLYPIKDLSLITPNMAMIACLNQETLTLVEEFFKEDFDVHVHPQQLSTDLCLKTSSKGKAISILVNHLNIDIKNTIAFGDGPNDMEMFQTVGTAIAMGNSIEQLKTIAHHVTRHVNEDGIYHYLLKQNLIKRQ